MLVLQRVGLCKVFCFIYIYLFFFYIYIFFGSLTSSQNYLSANRRCSCYGSQRRPPTRLYRLGVSGYVRVDMLTDAADRGSHNAPVRHTRIPHPPAGMNYLWCTPGGALWKYANEYYFLIAVIPLQLVGTLSSFHSFIHFFLFTVVCLFIFKFFFVEPGHPYR